MRSVDPGVFGCICGVDGNPYSAVQLFATKVDMMQRKGAEEARNQLPDLLDAAAKGRATIITRHGRDVAALVPIDGYDAAIRQEALTPVAGSGRGLWGRNSTHRLRALRDEWSR